MRDFEKTKLLGSDFDDTITRNSMEIYIDLYLPVLAQIGIEMTGEEFKEAVQPVWGASAVDVIGYVAGVKAVERGLGNEPTPEQILEAAEKYDKIYRRGDFVDRVEFVPGAIDALENVRERGVQVGIATGLAPELFDEILRKKGVSPNLFVERVSAYDIRAQKPQPYSLMVLKRIAEVIRGSRILDSEIVYVGDSKNDVEMARGVLGAEPVAVLTGNLSRQEALAMGIPRLNILNNICEIKEVLERREAALN